IMVLSKSKTDTSIQFIDASGEGFFKKGTNNNVLNDEHIQKVMDVFDSKTDEDYVAKSVSFEKVAENDFNLSVSSYVEAEDTREVIDIKELNAELKTIAVKADKLR
ncbi:N-6 DNA methylase, partial [Vibrio sp. 10N.222.49.E5]|uniref:N-6 DNA methylase n=1 Tax=Vibrio sp. 10N.222.49.E5 TaxID=3229617 RepID=UPI00354B706D